MGHNKFKKSPLALGTSIAFGAFAAGSAYAQDDMDSGMMAEEEVVVTGIRASLDRAMDVKRESSGVVDAISAEDMGKFPDSNLAESLQRITGVSIDRQNGEGSQVTVRGFGPGYNMVTLNNRQMPTDDGGRSFDFSNVASEGVSAVEVYKTSNATLTSGGIGATINIKTARPLDNAGLNFGGGIKLVNDQSANKLSNPTLELSGIYSQTFFDDKFGIGINVSQANRNSGRNKGTVDVGWRSFENSNTGDWGSVPDNDDQVNRPSVDSEGIYSVPQAFRYSFEDIERKRTNGQLVLQFAPIESLVFTGDVTMYNKTETREYQDVSAWFNFGGVQSTWTDGSPSTPVIYSDVVGDVDVPSTRNQDFSMGSGLRQFKTSTVDVGFNTTWQATDRWSFELDAHTATAKYEPNSNLGENVSMSTAAFIRDGAYVDFSRDLPALSVGDYEASDFWNGGNEVTVSDMQITGSGFSNTIHQMDISQVQLGATFEFDEGGSIDFGASVNEVKNSSQWVTVQNNDWGGLGSAGDIEQVAHSVGSVQDKFNAPTNQTEGTLQTYFDWDFNSLRDTAEANYTRTLADFSDNDDGTAEENYQSWLANEAGDCGTQFCASTDYGRDTDRQTTETTKALYAQLNQQFEIQGLPSNLSVGLRSESTDVDSSAIVPLYNGARWIADTEIALIQQRNDDGTAARYVSAQTGNYSYLLPNIDFNIEIFDGFMARTSVSKTIGRPGYGDISGGTNVGSLANRAGGSGGKGNANLKPLESVNFDLSVEWYYMDSSYVSLGYFRKDTTGWIVGESNQEQVFEEPIYNPGDGPKVTDAVENVGNNNRDIRTYIFENYENEPEVDFKGPNEDGVLTGDIYGIDEDEVLMFTINNPVNQDDYTVEGWEFAVQHLFWETGLGAMFNFTLVNSGLEFDNESVVPVAALTGLSDTYNFQVFFEKFGVSARLMYNYRDAFLNEQANIDGQTYPRYTAAYDQWDMSVSYDLPFLEGMSVFFEGINITDNYTREYSRQEIQHLDVTTTGPRYNLGARYTF